jgi:hypothetical protein
MVSVLTIEHKVLVFKPGGGDSFLWAIKIRSSSSLGWAVKLLASCEILRHVEELFDYERYIRRRNPPSLRPFS